MTVLDNAFGCVVDGRDAIFSGYDTCTFDSQRQVITVTADGVCIRVSPSLDGIGITVIIVQSFDGQTCNAVFYVAPMEMIITNDNVVVASVYDDKMCISDIDSTFMDIFHANIDVLETFLLQLE